MARLGADGPILLSIVGVLLSAACVEPERAVAEIEIRSLPNACESGPFAVASYVLDAFIASDEFQCYECFADARPEGDPSRRCPRAGAACRTVPAREISSLAEIEDDIAGLGLGPFEVGDAVCLRLLAMSEERTGECAEPLTAAELDAVTVCGSGWALVIGTEDLEPVTLETACAIEGEMQDALFSTCIGEGGLR